MTEELRWVVSTVMALSVVFIGTLLFSLIRAPVYMKWDKEKIADVDVQYRSGKRQFDFENPHLMWVELAVTNASSITPLENVEVQVASCIDILPIKEGRGDTPIKEHLYDRGTWSQISILWSELNVSPLSTKTDIPPTATKIALLAYQDDSNGLWTIYNAPISPKPRHLGGAKIEVAIYSNNSVLWKSAYYLECHPNYAGETIADYKSARFEFVEWDKWIANHNLAVSSP